jgi:hypothetical protein
VHIANEWCGREHNAALTTHSLLLLDSAGQYAAAEEFELLIARPRFASAMCKSGYREWRTHSGPAPAQFNFPHDHLRPRMSRMRSKRPEREVKEAGERIWDPAAAIRSPLSRKNGAQRRESPRGIAVVGIKREKTSCLTWLGYANNWGPESSLGHKKDPQPREHAESEAAESVFLFFTLLLS